MILGKTKKEGFAGDFSKSIMFRLDCNRVIAQKTGSWTHRQSEPKYLTLARESLIVRRNRKKGIARETSPKTSCPD